MQLKSPVIATVLGGLLLGITLRLAMPTTPLPAPEPAWRKSGAAIAVPFFSPQTYEAQAASYGYAFAPEPPRHTATGFVPHPREETLAYAEAALPQYDDPPREQADTDSPPVPAADGEAVTTELVSLPPADDQTVENEGAAEQ